MRRRLTAVILAAVLFVVLAASAAAYVLPDCKPKGEDTEISLFKASMCDNVQAEFLDEWKKSDKAYLFSVDNGDASFFYFVIPNEGSSCKVVESGMQERFEFSTSKGFRALLFTNEGAGVYEPQQQDGIFTYAPNTTLSCSRFVFTLDQSFRPPSMSYDYIASWEGRLLIVDDLGDKPVWDDEKGFLSGILEWLSKFWERLKAFFLSLFVPEEGYFSSWFEEIKAAFEKKVGGLTDVIEAIRSLFSGLNAGAPFEVSLTIPANHWWSGGQDLKLQFLTGAGEILKFFRAVFTGFVVLVTAIFCYRRLVQMVNS